MMYLEIKHLRMLRMIARTNNLTKAAGNLFISQPALSQQLKDIETKIGTPLFLRTGKNMVLTGIGKKLLNRAHIIIDEVEKAEREVAQAVNGEKGELKIGVRCMFCYKWLPTVIKQYQNKYPNVDLDIGNSLQQEKDLLSKTFDITISTSFAVNHKISFAPLFKDEILCVMSDEHPFSQKKFLEIEDFNGTDMIAMIEKAGPSFYNFFFKNKNVQLRRYMTIPHPEAVVDLVEAGLGIALLPKWFVSPYTLKKHIHTSHLTSKKTLLQWNAGYLKDKTMPPYQDEFIKIISSHAITNHQCQLS